MKKTLQGKLKKLKTNHRRKTKAEEATNCDEKGKLPKDNSSATVEDSNLECEFCDMEFDDQETLKNHAVRKHQVTSSPIPQIDGAGHRKLYEPNYCKVCEECPDEIETSEDIN